MSIFKRKPAPTEAVAPFDGWEVITTLEDGSTINLSGYAHFGGRHDLQPEEALRYVHAIADGLRAAGFNAEVRIERTQVSDR